MLTYETKNKLADFLLALSDGERQIEIVRQILAEQKEFEPYAAFRRIDRNRTGLIGSFEIQIFLADNGVHHSEKNINAFIRRYDSNRDGYLNYSEFLIAVLPMDNPTLRTIASQRPNYDVARDEFLPYDVEYALIKVIDREVSFYTNLDYHKFQLINRYDYNNIDGYNTIDRYHTGKIDYDNLKNFFRAQALFPYDEELIAVLRRLDKDDDGLIKYDEFAEGLEPVDASLKSVIKPTNVRYSSPLKRSSPRKIARSDLPAQRSPMRKSTSPLKKSTASISSPLKSQSPLRKTASPMKSSMTLSPSRRAPVMDTSLTKSVTRYESPIRKQIAEEVYTDKLIKSLDKPFAKSVYSPERRTLSPEKRAQATSPSRLTTSASKLRKGLDFDGNSDNKDALISTFKQFIALEKDLELSKQDLALRPDFNLLDYFRTYDLDGKGALTTGEVESGMKSFGVYPNKEELYLLCRRFDRDTDGKLRFSDFAEAFTPKQNEYASLLNNRTPVGDDETDILNNFSTETKRNIAKVLRLHLENEATTETLRQRLNKKVYFSIHDAFNYLDINEDGYITQDELKVILERHDLYATDKEVKFLVDRLDLNKDGKISYSEFVQEITPKTR